MGATSHFDRERGVCVSTGKIAPGGEEHVAVWGEWRPYDRGLWFSTCVASDWCESEDMRDGPPNRELCRKYGLNVAANARYFDDPD
jgi:hypothetical protein